MTPDELHVFNMQRKEEERMKREAEQKGNIHISSSLGS
jgi:hypothetical protein